jgi:hypothetical protein
MTVRSSKYTFQSINAVRNIDRILTALKTTKTYAQIAEAVCMSEKNVRLYVLHLRNPEEKQVRIKRYILTGAQYTLLFERGSKKDAEKPIMGNARRCARMREKLRKSPELRDVRNARDRARRTAARAQKVPQSWISALFVGVRVLSVNTEG